MKLEINLNKIKKISEKKEKPCPFLKNNLCSIYSHRPKDCKSYPHLHKNEFVFRLWGVLENCSICPIVFNVYEQLKDKLWYHGDAGFEDDQEDFCYRYLK